MPTRSLTPEQQHVLNTLLGVGHALHASPMVIKAAVETGLVESNLRNLPGGDADSAGWRQERASLYPNPTNLRASARRFFQEAKAARRTGHYSTAGALAAAVQRPAAQYRGRYQQDSALANRLLRGAGGGHASAPAGAGSSAPASTPGGTVTSDTGIASLLAQLTGQRPTVAISAPQLPSFAAHPTLPAGFVPTMAAWSPSSSPSTASLVDAVQQTSASAAAPRAGAPAKAAGVAPSAAGRLAPGARTLPLRPHGKWNGTSGPLYALYQRFGKPLGLQITSTKRHNTNPYSGSRSDHDVGNKSAYAIDASNGSAPTAQMDQYAYEVMHALGFKGYRKGTPINVSQGVRTIHGLQFQVIYRGNGPDFGGNHLTHVHVGVHRV